ELPVRGTTRSSRIACFTFSRICVVGATPETSSVFNCSTYSIMRLSWPASSFFSLSVTSRLASLATYSTSASVIFIGNGDLRDSRRAPKLVDSVEQLSLHSRQLVAPRRIGYLQFN